MDATSTTSSLPIANNPDNKGWWGYHLILDCAGCDIWKITDGDNIKNFIAALVERIGMTAYGPPILEHFATHDPDKGGYSVIQLIETSNICGHFVDKTGDCYLDIFSCKPYCTTEAENTVREFFNPTHIKSTLIKRKA